MPDQLEAVPCPRCGAVPRLVGNWRNQQPVYYQVRCSNEMCAYLPYSPERCDVSQAIDLWNQAAEKYTKEVGA
jgi:hypothetical protein